MLDQLRLQSEIISLEAVSGGQAFTSALSRLPQLFANTKAFLVKSFLNAAPAAELFAPAMLSRLAQRLANVNYAQVRSTPVFVPPGLETDLLSYAQVLNACAMHVAYLKREVLDPYQEWLARKLGDPAQLASVRPSTELDGLFKRPLAKLTKDLAACFDPKSTTVSVPYGFAFKRNADWSPLGQLAVSLQTHLLQSDQAALAKQVSEIVALLDRLIERIKSNDPSYKVSGPVVASLADSAYRIAKEVEFYGLVRHRADEFAHALAQTSEIAKRMVG